MNQKRINQMRSINRGQEQGLQQILQPMAASQLPQGQAGGNQAQQQQQQQSVRRKMTYTRTELLCRGLPTTQIPRRSPRTRGTYYQNNTIQQQQQQQHQSAVAPQTPLSAGPGNATSPMQSKPRSYLPRLSRLQSPNRNLTRKTEMDHHKPEKKTTPRVPNTPHASHCSISYTNPNPAPALGLGARNFRNEVSGIPVLDRNRNRNLKQRVEQRDINKEHIEVGNNTDTSSRSSRSSSPTDQSQVRVAKPILLPGEPQNKSFVYLCKPVKKVKELLTARQLRQSCENLKVKGYEGGETVGESLEPHKTNSEELLYSKAFEQGLELSSITEMSISPTSSTASQLQLQLQLPLQQLQQKQKQLQQLEDSNQQRLMSQLTTRHQQYRHQYQRQREMDMVCQNLPTLQHEIRLLQELNEKLESTLRGKQRSSHYDMDCQSSTEFYTPRCGPMLFQEMPVKQVGFLRVEHLARITQRVHTVAMAYSLAVVREFRIETKTLNELKASEETQCFYLPQPKVEEQTLVEEQTHPPPLQCTNLRMLRENPSVLIQQLRRGGGGGGGGNGSYNLLDHDMFMFINSLSKKSDESFLYSSLAVGIPTKDNSGAVPEYHHHHHHHQQLQVQAQSQVQELTGKMVHRQVNSTTQTEEQQGQGKDQEKYQGKDQGNDQGKYQGKDLVKNQGKDQGKDQEKDQNQEPLEALQLGSDQTQVQAKKDSKNQKQQLITTRKKRVIKRSPIKCNVEPKVHMKLFKTVLVGLVQVAVFLVLIMAFMYPDVSC